MTRITANIVILIMASVWAYLSVISEMMQPVSENFIYLGILIASGEAAAAADLPKRFINRKSNDNSRTED